MPQYLSPGVFVEEVPSSIKPIAGVGTSVAGFIGAIPGTSKGTKFYTPIKDESLGTGDGTTKIFVLKHYPVNEMTGTAQPEGTLKNDSNTKTATVTFATASKAGDAIKLSYEKQVTLNTPKLCTNFSEFIRNFSDFHSLGNNNNLAQAVYGFFKNGGTRCWATGVMGDSFSQIKPALDALGTIDEIALVAVPGVLDASVLDAVIDHCESQQDRFAILDGNPDAAEIMPDPIRRFSRPSSEQHPSEQHPPPGTSNTGGNPPSPEPLMVRSSKYAAMYYPWVMVPDLSGPSTEPIPVPPSGHIAGIYARVDTERGVHKRPPTRSSSAQWMSPNRLVAGCRTDSTRTESMPSATSTAALRFGERGRWEGIKTRTSNISTSNDFSSFSASRSSRVLSSPCSSRTTRHSGPRSTETSRHS